jgi:hypothetical protein
MTANLTTAFNNHFADFVNDILSVFPDDPDILTAKNALNTIRKANPKLLIKIWVKYIYNPYKIQIDNGDINFFLVKDYSTDFEVNDNSNKIIESIDRLRKPISNMSDENQQKTMKYIQNLSKLALLANQ